MITCYIEDETKTSLRHVTANALIIQDNQILLGKRGTIRGKPLLEYGKWGLIGGFVERNETCIESLKREIIEESGYNAQKLTLFRINDNPNRPCEDRQNIEFVFIAQHLRKIKDVKTEEIAELRWFSLDNGPSPENIAFDHGENIMLYKQYLTHKTSLPIF
jgi:ADP-ribose pyrophosphatase YjhB (NUDIX family)